MNKLSMVFQATISNEQTAALNSAHFDGEIIVVERDEQIQDVCRDLAAQKIIGFDTETRPSFKAGVTNKVALLQLSTHERCYLIRLCRTRLHNSILKILSNPNILKIGADVAGTHCATSTNAVSSTCNILRVVGASRRRVCENYRLSCWDRESQRLND